MVAASAATLMMPEEFNELVSQTSPVPGVAGENEVKTPVPPAEKMVNESFAASVAPTLLKVNVPPKVNAPPLVIESLEGEPPFLSRRMVLPESDRLVPKASVPIVVPVEPPTVSVPLVVTVVGPPMVPVPPSVPPATVTVLVVEASEPVTNSVPLVTVVGPVYVFAPESVRIAFVLLMVTPIVPLPPGNASSITPPNVLVVAPM